MSRLILIGWFLMVLVIVLGTFKVMELAGREPRPHCATGLGMSAHWIDNQWKCA